MWAADREAKPAVTIASAAPSSASERSDLPIPAGECARCHGFSRVIDTDPTDGHIRRRRECTSCGWRWTTREYHEGDWS